MMRRFWLMLSVLLVAFVVPLSSAQGKNMNGKFGFGFQRTMLDVAGFSFNYWTTPKLSLQVVVGTGFVLNANNDNATTVLASGGLKYVLFSTKYANLSVGARADIAWASTVTSEGQPNSNNVTQWGVELPLEVEFFFSDSFAVNLATGATFTMVPSEGALLTPAGLGAVAEPEYKGIGIGTGSLFGHAGFSFYF